MPLDARFLSPGQRYVPGILGGLGPLAHAQFELELLARNTERGARSDREHPVWIVASASSTPERTRALIHDGESALPHLTHFARLLERAGADALFVICNTAHGYHRQVQEAIGIPWVHLMHLTARHIRARVRAGTRVGILGTDGTLALRLYDAPLEANGLVPVAPEVGSPTQAEVLRSIFDPAIGIKATGSRVSDEARAGLVAAATWCVERGAEVVIPACTEVSVGLTPELLPAALLVNPVGVAADAALDLAYGVRQPEEFFVKDTA